MRLGFALVLVVTACSPAASSPATASSIPVGEAGAAAPAMKATSYDEAFSAMETRVRESRDGGMCAVAEYGTCGALRYIEEMPGGLAGDVRYYDESGVLVTTQHFNIDSTAAGSGPRWDGPAQTCGRKKIRDLCEK